MVRRTGRPSPCVPSLRALAIRIPDRAERGKEANETHVTSHDLPALLAALTPKRPDLLRYVRHREVRTIKALAADLHRDYKNVHKDVEELTKC